MGGEPGNDKKHFQAGYGLTLLDHHDQTTALTHFQQSLRDPPGDGVWATEFWDRPAVHWF